MNLPLLKKIISQLFIYFFILTACAKSSDEAEINPTVLPDSGNTIASEHIIKGMCIFAGQAETFSDDDWQALADSPVTDFVIIPKETSYYGDSESGYINKLTPFMVNIINQLVLRDHSVKVWVGTPGITSLNFEISKTSLDPIYNYLNSIRTQIGSSVWERNIGVYMNMEAIYGTMNDNNIYENPCIKLVNDLSYRIHNYLKTDFLWIPYYGYGNNATDLIKKIGYVANTTNIFNYIIIQPHYYFDETVPDNLTGVYHSVKNQEICYRNGVTVLEKTSNTIIGAEMEFSWKVVPPNDYTDCVNRYNEYVDTFSEFKNVKPIIFYWDGTMQNALNSRIVPFFQE